MTKEGYISTQAINDMLEYCRNFDGNDAICIFEKWFREQEPVQPKMGRWIMSDDGLYRPICNNCGGHPWKGYIPTVEEATEVFKYCPNCRARMEEIDGDS